MAWSLTGNIKGPQGEQGPPGVVAGNVTQLRGGTVDVGGDTAGNYTIAHGGGSTPDSVLITLNTDLRGGAEGWHVSVGNLDPVEFSIHINDTSGGNVSADVRIHWLAIWT